jgi:hypothetical protein
MIVSRVHHHDSDSADLQRCHGRKASNIHCPLSSLNSAMIFYSLYHDNFDTGKSAFGIMGYIHGIKWVYTISAWYMTFC